jgi:hypothetical protein
MVGDNFERGRAVRVAVPSLRPTVRQAENHPSGFSEVQTPMNGPTLAEYNELKSPVDSVFSQESDSSDYSAATTTTPLKYYELRGTYILHAFVNNRSRCHSSY